MIFRGQIKNGVAVFEGSTQIPDGTPVLVEVETPGADRFWQSRSIEDLAGEQGVQPIKRIEELRRDWPADESIDEFLAFIREARR